MDNALSIAPNTQHMVVNIPPSVVNRIKRRKDNALSQQTKQSYEYGWGVFVEWCKHQHGFEPQAGGVPKEVVLAYVDAMWEHGVPLRPNKPQGFKLSTIMTRLSAIDKVYTDNNLTSPTNHPEVKQLLRGLRNETAQQSKKGDHTKSPWEADPIEDTHLKQIIDSQPTNTLIGLRNRALVLMGWFLCGRRSELSSLVISNVRPSVHKVGGLDVYLFARKTKQDGGDVVVVERQDSTTYCPVHAYQQYMEAIGIDTTDSNVTTQRGSELVFRSIGKGAKVGDTHMVGGKLSPQAIDRIVWSLASTVLGEGRWSAHSLRAGYATTANRIGLSRVDICKQGGWSETSSVHYRYANRGQLSNVKRCVL